MMFPLIHCYHSKAAIPPHSFFIIRTGPDAGKPIREPSVDSYIVKCPHQQYFEFYFWLTSFLYSYKKYRTHHRGSTVAYVKLEDIRKMLRDIVFVACPYWSWQ